MQKALTIAALFAALAASPASAEEDCWVPMTKWQPRGAVEALAETNGWAFRRIKIDDGCYELVGTDTNGAPIEVRLNPATLEILSIRYENDDHEHNDGDHD